ncbi:interleukin-23 receptor [Hemicordylus capensis]|uniref:interleukin-23 receptor n=1 Tax=Hemicordylus capensis TaxID=884348 RepID=UPI0023042D72|nr:interleukin-23 receptor [Hemicordylus capensis]
MIKYKPPHFCAVEIIKAVLCNKSTYYGRELPGVVQCPGRVWTEPSPIIQMGQDFSINCHSYSEHCLGAKLYMHLNGEHIEDRLLSVINKTTVQFHLRGYKKPFSTAVCYVSCPGKATSTLICGTQFCMGYLPDKPVNVTCVIYEHSFNLTCSWDPGKDTHLSTHYKLYLKSLQTDEEQTFSSTSALIIIPLSQLRKNQTFSIWVHAANDLGTVHSDQLHINLTNLVIPATPIITKSETEEYPVFKTIIQWEKGTTINSTYCEERYKELASETWHVREWRVDFKRKHHTEYNLDANTKYEFQVRCRLTYTGSFWSKWSKPMTYTTPEGEPSPCDVWRYLGPAYQNGSQEVTILIKPFHPKESRGRILDYRVYYESQGEIMTLCNTTETKCKVLVPAGVSMVYVTARNSKRSSKPANITLNQEPSNFHDFPPPLNMTVICDEQKVISVKWEPPKSTVKIVLWYIVEWIPTDWNDHYHHDIVWGKVCIQNASMYIQGKHISMKRNLNISVYAVYQDGVSKACSFQCYTKELSLEKKPQDIHADNYLESTSAANGVPFSPIRANTETVDNKTLPLWESRDGSKRLLSICLMLVLDDGDVAVLLGIGTGVTFISLFLLALIAKKSFRKRISIACISVTPKWFFEDYPKVQNSRAIKLLQEKNGSVTHNSSGLFLDYEDTVVTEVEETLLHKEYKAFGEHKETRETVSEKEVPFVNNFDMTAGNGYKPQVSNKTPLESVFCNTSEIHSQNTDITSNLPASSTNILIKDYTSPMTSLWPIADTNENTFSFEKMNLVSNNSRSEQSNMVNATGEEEPMETQWKFHLSDDDIQEQTLIPDEMLSCLRVMNEDSTDFMLYFPQTIAK